MSDTSTTRSGGRQPLLDAAIEIAAEQGAGNVTVRAVAERAGVSPGTVSYHFPSVDDLLVSALESADGRIVAMVEQLVRDMEGSEVSPVQWAQAFGAALANSIDTNRARHLACFELSLLAARRKELLPATVRIQNAYLRAARAGLRVQGIPDSEGRAVRLTAMVTGLVLSEIVNPQPGAEQRLVTLLSAAATRAFTQVEASAT